MYIVVVRGLTMKKVHFKVIKGIYIPKFHGGRPSVKFKNKKKYNRKTKHTKEDEI
jgi:hypothetical protein